MLKIGMDRHQQGIKATWESARFAAWLAMAPHTKKLPDTPDRLVRFEWEKKVGSKENIEILKQLDTQTLKDIFLKKPDSNGP